MNTDSTNEIRRDNFSDLERQIEPLPYDDLLAELIECPECEGLGGLPCRYCPDEKVCLHYETCDECHGSGTV